MIPLQQCLPAGVAAFLRRQPLSLAKIRLAWRVAVGAAMDRATSVELNEDGLLKVETVGDRRWQFEVERSIPLILSRLELLLGPGVVDRIVAPLPPRGDPDERRRYVDRRDRQRPSGNDRRSGPQ